MSCATSYILTQVATCWCSKLGKHNVIWLDQTQLKFIYVHQSKNCPSIFFYQCYIILINMLNLLHERYQIPVKRILANKNTRIVPHIFFCSNMSKMSLATIARKCACEHAASFQAKMERAEQLCQARQIQVSQRAVGPHQHITSYQQ